MSAIMVHFSDRRYRLNGDEVGPTMELVRARLLELVDARVDPEQAETLFRILIRHRNYRRGRPVYPEPVTWGTIASWLMDNGPFNEEEVVPGGVGVDLPGEFVKESFTKGGHP